MFWHWLWIDNGRPRQGQAANVMRMTRARYHYAVRSIKRRECDIRKGKMAESIANNRHRDIWTETKKLTSGRKSVANVVDGACCPEDISEVFVAKYETIFRSVPTEPSELLALHRNIKSSIAADDPCYSSITVNDIVDGMANIKHGKQDGNYGLTSDHLINSSMKFKVILAIVMTNMLVHGYNAADLLSSTVISIPKNARGDMSKSDNYRGISLCNCICKLFDIIIMQKCSRILHTSDQQFAFKANPSITLCSGMLIESVNTFVKGNSCVYTCFFGRFEGLR